MNEVLFDYSKLRGRIKEMYSTESQFAKVLGISRTSLSLRLNNSIEFSQNEMKKSAALLNFSLSSIPVFFLKPKFRKLNIIELKIKKNLKHRFHKN